MPLTLHLLFLLLGLVLPVVLLVNGRKGLGKGVRRFGARAKIGLYYANGALLLGLAAIVLVVWYANGRAFTELGLGWGRMPYDLPAVAVIGAFILLYGIDIFAEIGSEDRQRDTRKKFRELGFLPADGLQYLHFLFLCVAAGVGEEIVYRGFLITYLTESLGTEGYLPALIIVLPAISFAVAHVYQGGRAVVKIMLLALLFGFFFYRTQSLWPLILLHTAIDAVGGLLSWYLEREE